MAEDYALYTTEETDFEQMQDGDEAAGGEATAEVTKRARRRGCSVAGMLWQLD